MSFTGDLVFTLQVERLVKIVLFSDKTLSGIQKHHRDLMFICKVFY